MKLPIDGVQAFVSIASLGSFQKAADQIALTQTALTRRIQRLEGFVGVRLLDRTTRSTKLTRVGAEFLPLARRLVDDLTTGIDRLRTTSRLSLGEVTVATLQSVAFRQLPQALLLYAAKHPRNRVQLLERSGALVTDAVRKAEADFGIHIHQEGANDLDQVQLTRDPFVIVCGRRHAIAKRPKLTWKALRGLDLITLGGASGNRGIVEGHLRSAGLEERGRFIVESTPSAIALCAAGVGVAILPAAMRAATVAQGLVEIPLVDPVAFRTISLVRRRNESLTPAASALYSVLQSKLRTAKAGDPGASSSEDPGTVVPSRPDARSRLT